jgi:hypothetical protein
MKIAIVGTREPDHKQKAAAFMLSVFLTNKFGMIVKTGGAVGIDEAAMQGAYPPLLEVILPWWGYNRNLIPNGANIVVANPKIHPKWFESVDRLHPAPRHLGRGGRALHARNYGILEDVAFVAAMPDERGQGGTGQAIRIAQYLDIPYLQANRGSIGSSEEYVRVALDRISELDWKDVRERSG